ncbi:MAG: hypothetical protein ABII18_04355 [bacterium]|nr:hypothetical protein [bacterium]MBU1916621.1 hypothetical protein [bacterium]
MIKNKFYNLIIIGLLILVSCGESSNTPSNSDDDPITTNWTSVTADSKAGSGIDPNIAIDSNGYAHACSYNANVKDLRYAYYDGSDWQAETVDSEGDVGEECGIAIDSQDRPHISYVDATNGGLKYAIKSNDSWNTETVESHNGYSTMATSIGIDSNDNPHIGYNLATEDNDDSSLKKVRYAHYNGTDWVIAGVYTNGQDCIFALDSADKAHFAFIAGSDDALRVHYSTNVTSDWVDTEVDSSTTAGGDIGIALDSSDNPNIIYNDYGNGAVMFAYKNGSSWSSSTIASDVGSGEGVKITVSNNDSVHVVFNDDENEKLMYGIYNGEEWSLEQISKMGNPSIAVDVSHNPHVAHYYNTGGGNSDDEAVLKYSIKE